MNTIAALLVVLIGVVVAGMFASAGNDIGTLVGVAVVCLGGNMLWSSRKAPAKR